MTSQGFSENSRSQDTTESSDLMRARNYQTRKKGFQLASVPNGTLTGPTRELLADKVGTSPRTASRASNAKYCSRECRMEARKQRSRAGRSPPKTYKKICLLCGKNFEATNKKTRYCFLDCYKMMGIISKRKKKKTEAEELLLDICSVCGAASVSKRMPHLWSPVL